MDDMLGRKGCNLTLMYRLDERYVVKASAVISDLGWNGFDDYVHDGGLFVRCLRLEMDNEKSSRRLEHLPAHAGPGDAVGDSDEWPKRCSRDASADRGIDGCTIDSQPAGWESRGRKGEVSWEEALGS